MGDETMAEGIILQGTSREREEMTDKADLRSIVKDNLDEIRKDLQKALKGGDYLESLRPSIKRLGRNGTLPHWFEELKNKGTLPNLDGKTVGSVIEMLFVSVLENITLNDKTFGHMKINPARGIDLPDLDLGVKSPSKNYCTSEPFFSAYERLYGSEYDCVVLLTNYQEAKKNPPLKLEILDCKYLKGSEIADEGLCRLANDLRDWLLSKREVSRTQRVFRFLAFVNQSDWRAKKLLQLLANLKDDDKKIKRSILSIENEFKENNKKNTKKGKDLIPESELDVIKGILKHIPHSSGILDEIENWVMEFHKDAARAPNNNEWERLLSSPLDGKIGMSFALQWRFNFSNIFNGIKEKGEEEDDENC